MSISHSLPASTRKPGRYFEFNIDAAARGLTPLDRRMVCVGQKSSAGTQAQLTPIQVFTDAEADSLFGASSELALMCKWSLMAGRAYGKAAEVWAIAIDNPAVDASNIKASQTLTLSGTATAAGSIEIKIAGRVISSGVAVGDLAATAAAALEAAIDEQTADLPIVAGVASAVVTCDDVLTGLNGNEVEYDVVTVPAGLAIASVQAVAGLGSVDITAALDVLNDRDYEVVAIANNLAADVTDLAAHLTSMWDMGAKRWRHSIIAERSTLATAQALATAADDFKQMVVSAEGFRNTPPELAAYVGMIIASEDDPSLPFNGVALPDLYLPDSADTPTNAEIESGIGGGLFMLSTNSQQTQAEIVRAVTTKTTHSAVPFYAMLDVTISRSMAYTARQIDIAWGVFSRAKKNDRTLAAMRSIALDALRQLEDLEILQNVDDHAGELVVETDPVEATRAVAAIPTPVTPALNQAVGVMNLIVE